MDDGKRRVKALVLSILVAIGLMAFAAPGAQASGYVSIEGLSAPFTAGFAGFLEFASADRLWVLGLNIEFVCLGNWQGTITNAGHGHATIKLGGCTVQGVNAKGELIGSVCKLEKEIVLKVLILVILHSSNPYLLFSPLMGPGESPLNETFGNIEGAPCAIPELAKLKGSFVARDIWPGKSLGTKSISTKGMLTLFSSDKLFYGANEAHLEADLEMSLLNSHAGRFWEIG